MFGAFEFDLVATITGNDFGETNAFSWIIYILIGISGIAQIANLATILGRSE